MEKFCPVCGASGANVKFIESFCSNCYGKRVNLECPPSISLQKCKKCGKVKTLTWNYLNETNVEQTILHNCKGTFADVAITKINDNLYRVSFLFKKSNNTFTIEKDIALEFRDTFCTYCLRTVSGYYEAILQLRGNQKKIISILPKLIHQIKKKNFLAKVQELKEGIDLYIGSKAVAFELVSKYGFSATRSNKLHGLKEGKRVYRTILCIRL